MTAALAAATWAVLRPDDAALSLLLVAGALVVAGTAWLESGPGSSKELVLIATLAAAAAAGRVFFAAIPNVQPVTVFAVVAGVALGPRAGATTGALAALVSNLYLGQGIKNNALEGATASITNIWGNNALLCRVQPGQSLQTATAFLAFQWTPEGLPGPMAVERYAGADPGTKVEVIAAGYWQTEKVIAPNLSYLIASTLA